MSSCPTIRVAGVVKHVLLNQFAVEFNKLTLDVIRYSNYTVDVIRSFRCKETEKIFKRTFSKKFPNNIQRIALRKLRMLNRARILNDLKVPPTNRLELLRGKRKGQYSIRINDQWRICFKWNSGEVESVEIVDYH